MKQKKKVNLELTSAVAQIMKSGELKTLADLNDLVKQLSSSFIEVLCKENWMITLVMSVPHKKRKK